MPKLNERATKAGVGDRPPTSTVIEDSVSATQAMTGYGLGPEWMTKSKFTSTFKGEHGSPSKDEGYLQVSLLLGNLNVLFGCTNY